MATILSKKKSSYSFCFFTNITTWRADYYSNSSVTTYTVALEDKVKLEIDENLFKINDIQYNDFSEQTFQVSQNLWLLGVNNRGSKMNAMSQKFYSAQIYDAGVLIRDYKPCMDSEGVTCLYEAVNNRYYYLDGTNKAVE